MHSVFTPFLLSVAALATGITSHPVKSACQSSLSQGAIYLLTNTQSNSVVSLRIDADGKLSSGSSTSTGGSGSNSIDGTTNQPAAPDALVSQSALTVAKGVCNLQEFFKHPIADLFTL